MSVRARHALRRGVAGLLAAIVLLAVSGFGVFRIARGAQEISGTFDADPGTFVQHDIVFILNTFSDPNGGSAQYGVVPIGGKLVIEQFYDQQNGVPVATIPLFQLDMWEHAFYLDYQNVKADYVKAIWNIVNWADVQARFEAARAGASGLILPA